MQVVQLLKHTIRSKAFSRQHKSRPQDFTRTRDLTFDCLIIYFLNLVQPFSTQFRLDSFFQKFLGTDFLCPQVTQSALTQARAKILTTVFPALSKLLMEFVQQNLPLKRWHGHRTLATDSSTVLVPDTPETRKEFGTQKDSTCPLARVSQLYDVLNHFTLHALLGPYRKGERDLATAHAPAIRPNDLLLVDQGYLAYWFFAWILSRSAHFCGRVYTSSWPVVQEFACSKERERIVTLFPVSDQAKKKCRQYGLPLMPITVRLIRIRLKKGVEQYLMTSLLDSRRYPCSSFRKLYHLRWGIEENYKFMKCRLEIERFSGKTLHAINQDFHARILLMNLQAVFVFFAQEQVDQTVSPHRKYNYRVNLTYALNCMRSLIVQLMSTETYSKLYELFMELISLLASRTHAARPNRSFARKPVNRSHRTFPMAY